MNNANFCYKVSKFATLAISGGIQNHIPYSFEYKVRALFFFSPKNCGYKSNAGTIRVRPLFKSFCFSFSKWWFSATIIWLSAVVVLLKYSSDTTAKASSAFSPFFNQWYLQIFHFWISSGEIKFLLRALFECDLYFYFLQKNCGH